MNDDIVIPVAPSAARAAENAPVDEDAPAGSGGTADNIAAGNMTVDGDAAGDLRADEVTATDATAGEDGSAGGPKLLLVESIGGWRGLFDSSIPVVVFVVANAMAGLTAAIWAALGSGVLIFLIRLVRRQTVQQAVSGFLGVAMAAFIAARTGEAKGYFLLGIWANFGYAAVFGVSVLVRWPLVGVLWEYVDGSNSEWRRQRPLMRVYTRTTVLWFGVFLSRGLVQRFLYDENRTGWLAATRLAMGYPVTLGALGLCLVAVRRVRRRIAPEPAPELELEPAPELESAGAESANLS